MTNTNHNIEDIYELTPLQQGMLFHTLYAPTSGMYVEQVTCKLLGRLNIGALQKAWRRVIKGNPVLRSSFYWEEVDKPLQIVHRHVELPWEQHNWSHESSATQRKLLEALLQRDQQDGFELTEAPLMRLTLITLGVDHYQFVWSSHHILMDGWSSALLFREVFMLYEGFQQGYESSLPTRRPYRDYILWLQQQDRRKAERFWRDRLQGFTAPIALGSEQSFQHAANEEQHALRERRLSPAKTEALQQFARQQHLTLNTLMQGAWALLLARYSGEQDVVFGVTMSGRPATLEQVENMIGLFINTLPVRVQLPPQMGLQHWLQQLQAEQVELMQYEYSSLLQVQEWSEVPAGTPLFGSLVIFENYPVYAPAQESEQSLKLTDVEVFEKTNYPLNLLVGPGQALLLKLIYSCRYFDDISSERMLAHLETLLDAMLARPTQPLWQISPLSEAELQQLLVTWNATRSPYAAQTIQQLVEAQAARTPEARAVTYGEETLSYAALNRRANQVAHVLRARGIGPETLVGLCVERSLEMIIGLLGILKAGGAYVPLDPAFPAERIAYMLEDAQVAVLLTQKRFQADLPSGKAHVIYLDEHEIFSLADGENPIAISAPEHLAYVIYTSGSTGRPKGVQITQRAAVNLLTSMQHKPGLTAQDRLLAVTTLSFDIATLEMLLPLITGAQLIIAPHEITIDGPALAALLEQTRATVMQATPITWRMLIAAGWLASARLKILCGGEALPTDLAQQLASTAGALYNVYGPTETTIWSTVELIEPGTTLMSIGRPIANTTIYLLDAHLQPVPTGIVGELYIGGDGLSRGYLHRPDLTAGRFLPDPFSNVPGTRIYRTGDLARYLEDGRLLCLGRADSQVKLRGFRIELGEIESILRQQADIQEAVVLLREDRPGDQRLVAYLVPEPADKLNETALIQAVRATLHAQLPDYMIPADIMLLESLPRTPNNKIDRKALPAPERRGTEMITAAPRSPIEQELALLWEELLGAQHVGRSDHFFALGGHSLLLTRLASRIQTAFHLEMPLRTLFEAATLENMAESITNALQMQHHLTPSEPIRAVSRERSLPLSFAQQRLWFLQQLDLQNPAYNMPVAIRLRGELAIPLLEQALREIVQRHESLRTLFMLVDGEPRQVIINVEAEVPTFSLPAHNLSELVEEQREEELQGIMRWEAQRPFHLSEELPVRAHLLQMDKTEYVLLLNLHHIVSDGWSMGVLIQEIITLYTAFSQGKRSPLRSLPIQYADFAAWQRQRLQGATLEALLAYWQRQLADAPPLLDLPTDHPRPIQQRFQGRSEHFQLSQELSQALVILAREEQVTLFMLLLSAFALLLSVYSRQRDILIGTPIANRTKQELEDLIGVFINTLVLRVRLNPDETFCDLLASVRDTTLAAYTHQDLPFESLVEILAPERDLSHHPLFQVMFVLQNAPMPAIELPGLQLQPVEIGNGSARFDLTLALEEGPEGLQGIIEYNTALFAQSTIIRIQKHFTTLLASVVKDPAQQLWQIALIDLTEKDFLLKTCNQTQRAYDHEQLIHLSFEEQVERQPEALAVQAQGMRITYAELNQRANRLAHYLRAAGIGPECCVGVLCERSIELITAWLGVLKAGGAYLPLDPAYPAERLKFMLHDARVSLVLTQHRFKELIPNVTIELVSLDAEQELLQLMPDTNIQRAVWPENIAYVIYTSGSTGEPKGVQISHSNLLNLVSWHQEAYEISEQDHATLVASPAFDACTWEIWPYLTIGASLHIPDEEMRIVPERLRDWLIAEQITISFLPTPLAEAVLALPWPTQIALSRLLTGGDKLHEQRNTFPFTLYNNYGPTEQTVVTTACKVQAAEGLPPLGYPIDNTQLYVLDAHLQPVPAGVAGELYSSGSGLARGYLHRAALTAEKFLPHPYGEPGERIYRTGDLVRYREDSTLEFLGRVDQQVKLRGFRIELHEIEAVLRRQKLVQEATVIVREDQPGDKRLVAYVVPTPTNEQEQFSGTLRNQLQECLPGYMVPGDIVLLDQLPLTPNGKIDQRALPVPVQQNDAAGYIAPRTPVEQQLATLWEELLNIVNVGLRDHFFLQGGHSLLLTRLATRIHTTFHLDLPLHALFAAATLAQMAQLIEDALHAQHHLTAPEPMQTVSRTQPLPLSFAQQRIWFLQQLDPQNAAYTIPSAILLRGTLESETLAKALHAVVQRHESLRTVFKLLNGEAVQEITDGHNLELLSSDLSNLEPSKRDQAVKHMMKEEAQKPFDLEHELPIRVRLLHLTAQEHILLLTMHHITTDAWSVGILIEEIATFYTAFCQGEEVSLPELAIQYADFAVWQRGWLQGACKEALLQYWQEQLKEAPETLDLPTDHPRPAIQTFNGATLPFSLPHKLSQELSQFARKEQVTLFMVLLAAFNLLLACYSRQNNILVGTPIANRTRQETERLIGVFINTLVLRTHINHLENFRQLLTHVRDVTLQAYTHQDLPFEALVEAIAPERNLGHHPLFQVMFGLQNAPMPAIELRGIELRALEIENRLAKFDLTVLMEEREEDLYGNIEYNTDLFEKASIMRLASHFQILLEQLVARPEQPLWSISPLSQIERYQIITVWNATQQDYPTELCVQYIFEAQVARTPKAVALRYQDQQVSFSELNQLANQLACYLQQRGIGPDILVGLHLARGLEQVIALLAVLKAGGAYLPLECTLPRERLALLIEQSHTPLVLTTQNLRDNLPEERETCRIISLELLWSQIMELPRENPQSSVCSTNLAYVLFTSGSTGLPKGVMIPHQGLVNYLIWATCYYQTTSGHGSPVHSPLGFDLTITSLFTPLLSGRCAQLLPQDQEIEALQASLQQEKPFSLIKLTPAHLALLNGVHDPETIARSARALIIGGEELTGEQVRFWQTHAPATRLINEYGPTETVVGCCTYEIQPLERFAGGVPIGQPIANTQLYVLDNALQPVPVGVSGELYIGGAGLARGYLQQPALTAERFLPHPYSQQPGARLYKSGDLARYRADGTLEYLGRLDHQVKIRGFRIEPGEIETQLNLHAHVQQNVVIVHKTPQGDKQLVAYIVGAPHGQPLDMQELRTYLQARLPSYMVPTTLIQLDALPVTAHGKVDRKKLSDPDSGNTTHDMFVAPRDELELQLAHIWEEILNVHPVGVKQSFFALGGHSLLAMRLVSEIEKRFTKKLPLTLLFQQENIERLAQTLRQEQTGMAWSPLVALRFGSSKRPFFCVHPAPGSVFCYLDLANALEADQPFYGLQARGLDGEQEPLTSVEEMAAYYIQAMSAVQPAGPYRIGGHSFGGTVAFEIAQQLRKAGEEVELLAILDNAPPIPNFQAHSTLVSTEIAEAAQIAATAHLIERFLGKALHVCYDDLVTLPVEEQEQYFLERLRAANFITAETGLLPLRGLLRVQQANGEAHMRYKPEVYEGQITLIRASTIDYRELGEMHPTLQEYLNEPTLGWSSYSQQPVRVSQISCDHIAMLTQPYVQQLAQQLQRYL